MFDEIKKIFRKEASPSEDLAVEPSLFLIFDPKSPAACTYILEIRIINTGGLPASIETIVCETSDKNSFGGFEKVFITDGIQDQSIKLQKKNDVFHENFVLKISSVAQFQAAEPIVFVTTRSGKVFKGDIDPKNIEEIKAFEIEKAARSN